MENPEHITEPITKVESPEDPLPSNPEDQVEASPEPVKSEEAALREELRKLRAEYGRQSNEVGELRAIVREMLTAKPQPEVAKPDSTLAAALGEDVAVALETRLKRIEETAKRSYEEAKRTQLLRLHPDVEQIVADPAFKEWVAEKPYRQKLFERADSGDVEAADELLSMYKERKTQQTREIPASIRAVRSSAAAPKPAKKVWTSVELGRLYLENPEEYRRLHDEIVAAYREGRVK